MRALIPPLVLPVGGGPAAVIAVAAVEAESARNLKRVALEAIAASGEELSGLGKFLVVSNGARAVQNCLAQAAAAGLTLPEAALPDVVADALAETMAEVLAAADELGFAADELAAGAALLLEPHPAKSKPDATVIAMAIVRRTGGPSGGVGRRRCAIRRY